MTETVFSATESALENQRIGGLQIRVAALCTLIQICDGYDINSVAWAVPSLTHFWSLPGPAFTTAFLWSSIGIMVGALSAGPIGDRVGRKPLLLASVTIFGLASLLSAFALSLYMLTVLRFFTGLGIGGAFPGAATLAGDYAPDRLRATMIMATFTGAPLGGFVGGQIVALLLPHFGWPVIFILGAVFPLVLVPVLAMWLPESPHFLAKGRPIISDRYLMGGVEYFVCWLVTAILGGIIASTVTGGERSTWFTVIVLIVICIQLWLATFRLHDIGSSPLLLLLFFVPPVNIFFLLYLFFARGASTRPPWLLGKGYALQTVLLWVIFFCSLMNLFLFGYWLPEVLHLIGMTPAGAVFASSLRDLGAIFAVLYLGLLIDRVGPERSLAFHYAIGAVFIAVISLVALPYAMLLAIIFLCGMTIIGSQTGANATCGKLYPARMRTSGLGWALGIGRLGGIAAPVLGGYLLSSGMAPTQIFLSACGFALVAAAATGLLALRGVHAEPLTGQSAA
jgi:MFS transporter, AAHS family, 4-hydroxybenzoate transporter